MPTKVTKEIQRTSLLPFVPYVLVTTLLLVGLPLALALFLSAPPLELPFLITTVACTALSMALGRVGAEVWQRRPQARDVVFFDLTLWGFLRRVWNQRRIIAHVERLAVMSSGPGVLGRDEHTKSLKRLARALESGDPYTHGHSDRVARHAYMVARTLKLPKQTCDRIRLAGALHDVGKVLTPREILTKPHRLSDEEFEIIKRHPVDGAAMVDELEDPELTAIVRHHHERIDGTGYPSGLARDAIPLGARIMAVADTFDAITSHRPYRPPRVHKDAIRILENEAGRQLDPAVVEAFITYYTGKRGIRLWTLLTTSAPRLAELSLTGLQRAAASTVVSAGAAGMVVGGSLLPTVGDRAASRIERSEGQAISTEEGSGTSPTASDVALGLSGGSSGRGTNGSKPPRSRGSSKKRAAHSRGRGRGPGSHGKPQLPAAANRPEKGPKPPKEKPVGATPPNEVPGPPKDDAPKTEPSTEELKPPEAPAPSKEDKPAPPKPATGKAAPAPDSKPSNEDD